MSVRIVLVALAFCAITGYTACYTSVESHGEARRLLVDDYRSKMKAGWIGQMVGVGWGAPAEWTSLGAIIPAEEHEVLAP